MTLSLVDYYEDLLCNPFYVSYRQIYEGVTSQIEPSIQAFFESTQYSTTIAICTRMQYTLNILTFPAIYWTIFGPFLVYIGHRIYHLCFILQTGLTGLQVHYFYTVPKTDSKLRKSDSFPFPLAVLAKIKFLLLACFGTKIEPLK